MSAIVAPHDLPEHPDRPLLVIVLCAQWCGVCRDFRPIVDATAALHPQAVFSWLDIEDDAALLGELDVEDFPTLAVFREGTPVYFGASLPLANVLGQLVRTALRTPQALSLIPDEALQLHAQLMRR